MNNYTKYILAFILITGPGLIVSVHAALCDPMIAPCGVGSCMPCNLGKKEPVEQNDCTDSNGCPEITKVKIEPPFVEYAPLYQPSAKCLLCFWKINGFFWYNNV
ncbi:uncharacterized protein LOC111029976 [Myzus persicae]|uniref:uncharacterized protein LOC111029976 n=1 Tax=Myzus persicae TaxID=13164 RepID=UPI000B932C72|nr:uncharacterized protein LOC111029976 [Myzus persicae]